MLPAALAIAGKSLLYGLFLFCGAVVLTWVLGDRNAKRNDAGAKDGLPHSRSEV